MADLRISVPDTGRGLLAPLSRCGTRRVGARTLDEIDTVGIDRSPWESLRT
jgi:hypothetical protein